MKVRCSFCDKEIDKCKWKVEHYKTLFCSRQCKGLWMSKNKIGKNHPNYKHGESKGSDFICITCGKKNIRKHYKQKYCNQSCQLKYEYANGIRNGQEITKKAHEAVIKGPTYQNFRTRIFKHYPHICVMCGSTEKLVSHHIIPQEYNGRRANGKGNHTLKNGMIVCIDCHTEIHKNWKKSRNEILHTLKGRVS